ncbi:MAG: hypothetical protein J6L96_07880 [Clostridia bacterium]|nr:hypothetical protein [Clostridia bacterium]
MFGYVRPFVPEMKVGEYEKYRGVYCGLCRAMGEVTGQLSRLTLSYDFVFLASVRMVLCGIKPEFETFRCATHPTKKRLYMKSNDALRYTAALSALLAEAKVRDDLTDERGMAKLKPKLVHPMLKSMAKRGGIILPEESGEGVADLLRCLTVLENEKCTSADLTADAFGGVLEYVFSLGIDGRERDIAGRIGKSIGRFIYMCDAADDLPDDVKRGRYNPFSYGWGDFALTDGKMSEMVRDSVMTSAPIDLEALGETVELLDPAHEMTPIIKNIVYLGLPAAMKRILYGQVEGESLTMKEWKIDT